MSVIDVLEEEVGRLDFVISMAMEDLGKAPEGRLTVRMERGRARYYLRCSGSGRMVYLSERRDLETVKALAQKAYAEKVLREACRQKALLDGFMADYDPQAVSRLADGPGRTGLVSPYTKGAPCGPFASAAQLEVDPTLVAQLKEVCSRILNGT